MAGMKRVRAPVDFDKRRQVWNELSIAIRLSLRGRIRRAEFSRKSP
jgi:hypothetical protein